MSDAASPGPTDPQEEPAHTESLVLDADELKALQIFHRSFNLPGLRYGLVQPIDKEDYFPPEEEVDAAATALRQQADETSSLLQRAAELLESEITEEAEIVQAASGSMTMTKRVRSKPGTPVGRRR
uniref:Uncharacterized protein n=1 Tax=Chrysotila carterae TaxID=13221 RepID=A0A7S4FAT6_CHRCT|mmetsp:Transcript_32814/g.69086  ORF Transcript_32814/g.69086 Transcript_32814/m.69086 type:complete len:126 (+) Transcript_32814:270-647(+)